MTYRNLIIKWHRRAQDAINRDPFSAFVFEYLAFIALLKTELHDASTDRNSIQNLKQNNFLKEKYLSKIQSDPRLAEHWDELSQKLKEKSLLGNATNNGIFIENELKWWNCDALRPNECGQEPERRQKGIIHDMRDWGNMVEFWYSVRNNMFHGTKDPENERDIFLVEKGFKTLKVLMDILLL